MSVSQRRGRSASVANQGQRGEPRPGQPLKVFISYAHEDEAERDELGKHLAPLTREGLIDAWYDRLITAGRPWGDEIDHRLQDSHIVLLLVSASFLDSDYCNGVEMEAALRRASEGKTRVIPIILRPCDWHSAPFRDLVVLPKNERSIVQWQPVDAGYLEVARGLRSVVDELSDNSASKRPAGNNGATRSSTSDERHKPPVPDPTARPRAYPRRLTVVGSALAVLLGLAVGGRALSKYYELPPLRLEWVRLDHQGISSMIEKDIPPQRAVVIRDDDHVADAQGRLGGWPSWTRIYEVAKQDSAQNQLYWLLSVQNTGDIEVPETLVSFADDPRPLLIRNIAAGGIAWCEGTHCRSLGVQPQPPQLHLLAVAPVT